jgi:hypothetical protein
MKRGCSKDSSRWVAYASVPLEDLISSPGTWPAIFTKVLWTRKDSSSQSEVLLNNVPPTFIIHLGNNTPPVPAVERLTSSKPLGVVAKVSDFSLQGTLPVRKMRVEISIILR